MQRVRCYDCGKAYDCQEDCFCPNCGAFNQPQRSLRIGADGSVVRVDGINETNHAGSFVHRELHEEKRERRRMGLDKGAQRTRRPAAGGASAPVPLAASSRSRRGKQPANPFLTAVGVIILIILFNIISRIAYFL